MCKMWVFLGGGQGGRAGKVILKNGLVRNGCTTQNSSSSKVARSLELVILNWMLYSALTRQDCITGIYKFGMCHKHQIMTLWTWRSQAKFVSMGLTPKSTTVQLPQYKMSAASLSKSHSGKSYFCFNLTFPSYWLCSTLKVHIITLMNTLSQSIITPPVSFEDWVTSRMHNTSWPLLR